jgi:two-component system chemotaxis response regulator CheB
MAKKFGKPPIRVLVIDDSVLVRKVLTRILKTDPDIEVVGTATDPYDAREKIKQLDPDVLTLDVEMPRMDGITFLRNLMRLHPMPVVMVASLTEKGADVTLQALELGAIDFISKPKGNLSHGLGHHGAEIIDKLKAAARAHVAVPGRHGTVMPGRVSGSGVSAGLPARPHLFAANESILAIGASTGGTEAIRDLLMELPATAPATVITQHIPAAYSGPFARRVNSVSAMTVCEARDGERILPGHAYIAPGDRHLQIVRNGHRYCCRLGDGPPVNRHRPSVDVLFRSVAEHAGGNAIGVLLTGMGDDGAQGLLELQEAGATTIAQDEATSVVWGMPGAAVKLGAADMVLPLDKIAGRIMARLQGVRKYGS